MDRGQRNPRKLSRAIRTNIADLVDTMPFNDSEILDILIQEGCITEDECKGIREKVDGKDQVRNLVILVKGRNFNFMKIFLDTIVQYCPTVVEKIWSNYENSLQDNLGPRKCPMCELKDNVDVKYVIDFLYGKGIIATGLYSCISDSRSTIGRQDDLWDSILEACKGENLKFLIEALKVKGHYNHISDSLHMYRMGKFGESSCSCPSVGTNLSNCKPESDETGSSTSYYPNSTPFTSTDDVTREDINIIDDSQYYCPFLRFKC